MRLISRSSVFRGLLSMERLKLFTLVAAQWFTVAGVALAVVTVALVVAALFVVAELVAAVQDPSNAAEVAGAPPPVGYPGPGGPGWAVRPLGIRRRNGQGGAWPPTGVGPAKRARRLPMRGRDRLHKQYCAAAPAIEPPFRCEKGQPGRLQHSGTGC